MAVINPAGWLQNAGSTHTAAQMRTHISGLSGPANAASSLVPKGGVHPELGNKLQVTQTGSPSMGVLVKSGQAWVPGTEGSTQGAYGVLNDADVTLTVTTADPTNPRIDIVCFKVEDSQYSGANNTSSLVVVAGTPAGSPSPPTAPNNSITLAQIAVGAGVTSIINSNITDTRTYLPGIIVQPDVQVFTSSGTWNKPQGAQRVRIRVVGSGGGGGGAQTAASAQHANGGGGGGGAYSEGWVAASTLAASVAVTIGAGGTAGSTAGGNGGNGAACSFGSTITANGGSGGSGGLSSAAPFGVTGGAGGTAGTIPTDGFSIPGVSGFHSWGDGNLGTSGAGGSTVLGAGGSSRATGSNAQVLTGNNGTNYGGGGGGGLTTSASASGAAGGVGATGVVIVETYF